MDGGDVVLLFTPLFFLNPHLCVCVFVQDRAAVPEGHVFMASTSCKHEECGVLELPSQRHQECLWMEPGHGEIHSVALFSRCLTSAISYLRCTYHHIRYVASLLQSDSRLLVTWTPTWPTSWLIAKRAHCSRLLKDGNWRKTSSRRSSTARTCCSTWRPVR